VPPSPKQWPTAARKTACASIAFIRAWWRPNDNGGASGQKVARTGETGKSIVKQRICTETGITRFGTVQDVADLVCFMVSARATWLQGATIDLDGGGEIPVL